MSQPLIIGAVGLAVLDTAVADLQSSSSKGPQFRIVIGGFVVMVGLLALSDYKEDIADGLAILILLTTLVGPKGGTIGTLVTKLTAQGSKVGASVVAGANKGATTTPTSTANTPVRQS